MEVFFDASRMFFHELMTLFFSLGMAFEAEGVAGDFGATGEAGFSSGFSVLVAVGVYTTGLAAATCWAAFLG